MVKEGIVLWVTFLCHRATMPLPNNLFYYELFNLLEGCFVLID